MRRFDQALAALVPVVPKPLLRVISRRYIAGAAMDEALAVVAQLSRDGKLATVDVLGEGVDRPGAAEALSDEYCDLLHRMRAAGVDPNVSVKLTGIGLGIDREVCLRQIERILDTARTCEGFVRIDMESSATTDAALEVYGHLRSRGYGNVGVVLQAYLHRTMDDIPGLENVRLCKGIYREPPAIALQEPDAIRQAYLAALERLLDQGSYVGIATHDESLIVEAERAVVARGLDRSRYEFQMLLGVRAERGDALVRNGHRVRVYVPYGTHWHAYATRRLKENPRIAGYVARDLVGSMRRRR